MVHDHSAYLHGLMAELDRAAISLRLGESLKTAGIRQQEMAELLRTSKRSIEDYVSPKLTTVPFDRLGEWAEITGVTKEWLLHGANVPRPSEISELRDQIRELRDQVDVMLRILLERDERRAERGAS